MKYLALAVFLVFLVSCKKEDPAPPTGFDFIRYTINGEENYSKKGVGILPEIKISFSAPIDSSSISSSVTLWDISGPNDLKITLANKDSVIVIKPVKPLKNLTLYELNVDNTLISKDKRKLNTSIKTTFSTAIDTTDKFPRITDDSLLTLVQKHTFRYFWDFGHPVSGLARERNNSGDLVTSGGSGFGIMCLLSGVNRGFITRQQGLDRMLVITDFLLNKADRFHGVFPHWLNGVTGKTIPFSTKDNGGDIVETSYLIAGLLSASEYFDKENAAEILLRDRIKQIWETVEWNWHTKGSEKVLYWHWSPNYNWEMNHQLRGWNEALITYVLAAASPTFPISKDVYDQGWALNGAMKNGRTYYGHKLPLGPEKGGPLFFAHYSFLGINPHKLKDQYADYWQQVVSHTLINYEYCKANPAGHYGYGPDCWGLTASDNKFGYSAHSPTNDQGVVSPTAALSSLPYTYEESMAALRFFYYKLGDRLFGQYGFVDAFDLNRLWFAQSYLAIDQGPILVMIENHRSGLIWESLMKNADVRSGLDKLGFTY